MVFTVHIWAYLTQMYDLAFHPAFRMAIHNIFLVITLENQLFQMQRRLTYSLLAMGSKLFSISSAVSSILCGKPAYTG